jgi:hypothetical protein
MPEGILDGGIETRVCVGSRRLIMPIRKGFRHHWMKYQQAS